MPLIRLLGTPLLVLALAAPAWADASPWSESYHAKARLLSGGAEGDALLIGVHIELDRGWKTYWRTPGDSGLPPDFDWSGSQNLKSARVLWPAPMRFRDSSGTFAGYKGEVIFPVLVHPESPGRPVLVHLNLQYAICETICVPAEATVELSVSTEASAERALIDAYRRRVPQPSETGSAELPRLGAVQAQLAAAKPHLIVEAVYPRGARDADLLVEAPDYVYLPMPKRLTSGDGERVLYRVDLDGSTLAQLRGKSLLFTLVSGDGPSSEARWKIPPAGG